MSQLQPRQCHKCQGVMVPMSKTTYNFIASTYHYECTSCHAKTSIPDVVSRGLQIAVGGALLYFGAADGGLLVPGIGTLMLGYGLLAGRRNPLLDLHALAAKVAAAREAEAAVFHPATAQIGTSSTEPAAPPARPEISREKPRMIAPAAPPRRPTVERVGGFGRRAGTTRGTSARG